MNGRHILVVDDDSDLRDGLAGLLEEEGYQVSVAANGREALERLATPTLPHVIVLDLMMPQSDGYDFRAKQQADARLARIPVIAMTAGRADSRLADLAADGFLRKPFEFEVLVELIKQLAR